MKKRLDYINNFKFKRASFIDNHTDIEKINVKIYIDGNHLFTNLNRDLKNWMKLIKDAYNFFEIVGFPKNNNPYDDLNMETELFNPRTKKEFNFKTDLVKLNNLSQHYINYYLKEDIENNITTKMLEKYSIKEAKEKILLPKGKRYLTSTFNGIYIWKYFDPFYFKFYRKNLEEKVFNELVEIYDSLPESKNLNIANIKDNFFKFLDKNENIKYKIMDGIDPLKYMPDIDGRTQVKIDYEFTIYKAEELDLLELKKIFEKKISNSKISNVEKKWCKKNLELIPQGKIVENMKLMHIETDVQLRNLFFKNLEKNLQATTKLGKLKIKDRIDILSKDENISLLGLGFSEKKVDSTLISDCTKAMLRNDINTVFCIITNDSDFEPLIETANEEKKHLLFCSMDAKKRIAKDLKEKLGDQQYLYPKSKFNLNIYDIRSIFWPNLSNNMYLELYIDNFLDLVLNDNYRKKIETELTLNINEQIKNLRELRVKFEEFEENIKTIKKRRYE